MYHKSCKLVQKMCGQTASQGINREKTGNLKMQFEGVPWNGRRGTVVNVWDFFMAGLGFVSPWCLLGLLSPGMLPLPSFHIGFYMFDAEISGYFPEVFFLKLKRYIYKIDLV